MKILGAPTPGGTAASLAVLDAIRWSGVAALALGLLGAIFWARKILRR